MKTMFAVVFLSLALLQVVSGSAIAQENAWKWTDKVTINQITIEPDGRGFNLTSNSGIRCGSGGIDGKFFIQWSNPASRELFSIALKAFYEKKIVTIGYNVNGGCDHNASPASGISISSAR